MNRIVRELRQYWLGYAIVAAIGFWIYAIASVSNGAAEYTKACNAKGGVAIHADSPSRRQCVKGNFNPIIWSNI